MTNIINFNFKDKCFRSINQNGEVLFCLADVCNILGLQTNKVKERLNPKGWNTIPTLTNGGMQDMTFINEPNFYKTVLQSRKPQAEPFTDWVTGEVLPSIRKHGAYMTPQTLENVISDPEFGIKLLTALKDERSARMIAEQNEQLAYDEIKILKPKAERLDNIAASENKTMIVKQIAKDFGMSDQVLNAILHELGVQYKQRGQWLLYQKYANKGYDKTDTSTGNSYTTDEITGERILVPWSNTFTVWTHKGRIFIHDLIDPLIKSKKLVYKSNSWYLNGEKVKVRN